VFVAESASFTYKRSTGHSNKFVTAPSTSYRRLFGCPTLTNRRDSDRRRRADSASEHIGEHLLDLGDWERRDDPSRPDADGGGTYYRTDGFELREFDDLHIYLDDPAAAFGGGAGDETNDAASDDTDETPEFLAFVSRHSGETGELLTAHVTGNFGPAPYGGEPDTLARAAPGAEKRVVEALAAHAPEGYDVGIECTHHGPTDTSVPSLFVELGSDEPQWTDADAARAVARAVLDLRGTDADLVTDAGETTDEIDDDDPHPATSSALAAATTPRGSPELSARPSGRWDTSAPTGRSENLAPDANRDVIEQAFARSKANVAVIEGEKPDLEATVEALGHRVVSETWVRAVGDRPLPLVERLESDLATIDEGLRFGEVVPASPDAIRVRGLPEDLLSRAQGVDADAARVAVETNAVAFDTEQAGTRAAGSVAFADDEVSPGYDDSSQTRGRVGARVRHGRHYRRRRDSARDRVRSRARRQAWGPGGAGVRAARERGVGRSRRRNDRAGGRVARADKPIPDRLPTDSAAEPPTEPSGDRPVRARSADRAPSRAPSRAIADTPVSTALKTVSRRLTRVRRSGKNKYVGSQPHHIMDSIVEDAIDEAEESPVDDSGEAGAGENGATAGAPPQTGTMTDDELQDVLQDLQTNITVVGCGGAGGNTVNRMTEEGIHGAKLVAANTDVQHLVNIEADTKILMGQQKTQGRGAGSLPQVGEEAAIESQEEIQDAIDGSRHGVRHRRARRRHGDRVRPVVAKAARESGALTIAIVTTPSLPRARSDERTPRPASNGSAT